MSASVFTKVNYLQFRDFVGQLGKQHIRNRGYETVIYDRHRDIQAIVHSASIDEKGQCHPAIYYIRDMSIRPEMNLVA
jgi:hypothetical protein